MWCITQLGRKTGLLVIVILTKPLVLIVAGRQDNTEIAVLFSMKESASTKHRVLHAIYRIAVVLDHFAVPPPVPGMLIRLTIKTIVDQDLVHHFRLGVNEIG